MPYSHPVPVGTDSSYQINLLDEQGNPVTTYTSSDTLSAVVWRGNDQPVLFQPRVTWLSAPAGTITLTISGTDTAGLEPGKYSLRVLVDNQAIPDSFLDLTASPGSAATYTSYCSYRDMLDYFPALEGLQDVKDDEGFARQRKKARTWLERIIQRNRTNSTGYTSFNNGTPMIYGYGSGWSSASGDDNVLQGYLDSDLLLLKPIVVEMCAKKALGYVCSAQIGPDDKATIWQKLGARFDAEAEQLACLFTAEIDLNEDGYSDITIPCGRSSNR